MTEFKIGDRVKVEFVSSVGMVRANGDLRLESLNNAGFEIFVPRSVCTLVEPEIVLPEVPGTIVQVDPADKLDQRATFVCCLTPDEDTDIWSIKGKWYSTERVVSLCRKYGYRIIEAVTE